MAAAFSATSTKKCSPSGSDHDSSPTITTKHEPGAGDWSHETVMDRLGVVLSRVEDPFFCQGKATLYKPLTLQLMRKDSAQPSPSSEGVSPSGSEEHVTLTLPTVPWREIPKEVLDERGFFPIREKDFEILNKQGLNQGFQKALDEAFEVSPFGHGSKTVVDESVRKALQVKADRIVSTGINLEELGILDWVRIGLTPSATRIHATLDKLNLYTAGGHFKSHKDTPRDEHAFGTLVVALPSKFQGGNLIIKHRGRKNTCKWGGVHERNLVEAYTTTPANVLQWCAFYGDCDHHIEKVVFGHRLTLTYILRYDPKDDAGKIAESMKENMGAANLPLSDKEKARAAAREAECDDGEDYDDEDDDYSDDEDDDDSDDEYNDDSDDEEYSADSDDGDLAKRAAKVAEALQTLTAPMLKAVCRTQGVAASGNKQTLIQRISEAKKGSGGASSKGLGSGSRKKVSLPDTGTYPPDLAVQFGTELHREMKNAIATDNFFKDGGLLGVACMHLYEQDADLPPLSEDLLDGKFDSEEAVEKAGEGEEKDSEGKSADGSGDEAPVRARDLRLKGADALVYMCAARLGLRPMVLRVCWDDYGKYSLTKLPSLKTAYQWTSVGLVEDSIVSRTIEPEVTINPDALGPYQNVDTYDEASLDTEGIAWITVPPFERNSHTSTAPSATILTDIFMSNTGYFGNEASRTTYYAAAAIVMVVPPAGSEGRKAMLAKACHALGTPTPSVVVGESPANKRTKVSHGRENEPVMDKRKSPVRAEDEGGALVDPEAFEGLRLGLDPEGEKKAWSRYFASWKKKHPDITRSDALELASAYGCSTSGSTQAILNRVSRRAEKERMKGFEYGEDWY